MIKSILSLVVASLAIVGLTACDDSGRREDAVKEFETLCDEYIAASEEGNQELLIELRTKINRLEDKYDIDDDKLTEEQAIRISKAAHRVEVATGFYINPEKVFD